MQVGVPLQVTINGNPDIRFADSDSSLGDQIGDSITAARGGYMVRRREGGIDVNAPASALSSAGWNPGGLLALLLPSAGEPETAGLVIGGKTLLITAAAPNDAKGAIVRPGQSACVLVRDSVSSALGGGGTFFPVGKNGESQVDTLRWCNDLGEAAASLSTQVRGIAAAIPPAQYFCHPPSVPGGRPMCRQADPLDRTGTTDGAEAGEYRVMADSMGGCQTECMGYWYPIFSGTASNPFQTGCARLPIRVHPASAVMRNPDLQDGKVIQTADGLVLNPPFGKTISEEELKSLMREYASVAGAGAGEKIAYDLVGRKVRPGEFIDGGFSDEAACKRAAIVATVVPAGQTSPLKACKGTRPRPEDVPCQFYNP